MSLEKVDAEISRSRSRFIVYSLLMAALVGGTSALFLLLTVHRPVRQLVEGTRQVAAGNLSYRIRVRSRDEIGELAGSFNEMTRSLQQAREQNESWSRTLEKRVQEKTEELNKVHEQILQVEKMASLGRLSATVAHELNNPLEGILTYAKLTARRLQKVQDPAVPPIREDLELIIREVQRCGSIVKNLLLFSRKQVGEFGIAPVAGIVEQAVRLVQHHFDICGVSFQQEMRTPDASILCDGNQIQQALLALFVNAVESMTGGGTLRLVVDRDQAGNTIILISDTGTGIAPEELPHIFEPFYTTKKEGNGIGLGLSVVYGIVERHGGAVTAHSEPGKGTVFTLTFPPVARSRPSEAARNLARV
jgi:two-component system NtrC family sensor kinase